MKTSSLAVSFALTTSFVLLSFPVVAQDAALSAEDVDHEKALTAIQFMNYLRYVSYEIAEYNNAFVLEEEYRNLSTDNLNLGRIPDEQIEQAIKDHLQSLFQLRLEEKERERFQSQFLKLKQRRRQDMFVHLFAGGVNSALDGDSDMARLFAGDSEAFGRQTRALMEKSVSVYDDYVAFQREMEDSIEESNFKFDVDKMTRLHEDNLKNFDFTLDLIRRYGIDDKLRLTEEDSKALVSCVKASNKEGAFAQLKVMAKHQPSFTHFPFFWCQYASFAAICGHPQESLEACSRFADVNKFSLFRRDRLAAQTAMAKVQSMLELGMTNESNHAEIKNSLLEIVRFNYDSHDYDMAYYCATTAHSILGDDAFALEILNGLIGAQERQASKELVKYRDLYTNPKKDQKFETVPILADMLRCIALRTAIEKGENNDSFRTELAAILGNTVVQGVEKLFFIGEVRKSDLFKRAKSEIDAIRFRYDPGLLKKDSYHALVPASWFVLGDFPVSLELMRNTNTLETINADPGKRTIVFDRTISPGALVKAIFPRKSYLDTNGGIDGFRLNLPNSSWPVSILYMPNGDGEEMTPISVSFLGSVFPITDMEAAKKHTMDILSDKAEKSSKDENAYCLALTFPNDSTDIGIHDLVSAEADGNAIDLAWKNPDGFTGTLSVSAQFFNEFGYKLFDVEKSAETNSGVSGTLRLEFPQEMNGARTPVFVLFSCRRKEPKKGWRDLKKKLF